MHPRPIKEVKARIAEEKAETPAYKYAVKMARGILNSALCDLEDHKELLRELRVELRSPRS
jgi:hypothetical protein